MDFMQVDRIIMNALKEDIPFGDITTEAIFDHDMASKARLIAKDEGIIAGLDVAQRVFNLIDSSVLFEKKVLDGQLVKIGDEIAQIHGNTCAMLKAERTALNILQRLSGIATKTQQFVNLVKDLPVRIVDTRKTTPGLRLLEKYAVRVGGGHNHRYCLSDGVLIKDNHIKAAGGITQAIDKVRSHIPHTIKIEVETESIEQVQEALDAAADIIMLDNMSIEMMTQAVKVINKRAMTEASGNVNLDVVYDIAKTGVDIISIGGITHSVQAFDISLKFW